MGPPRRTHDQNPCVADRAGRLIAFEITPGQRGDIRAAAAMLATLPKPDYDLADTAYEADKRASGRNEAHGGDKPNPTRSNDPRQDVKAGLLYPV